jgi:hypothetical protein
MIRLLYAALALALLLAPLPVEAQPADPALRIVPMGVCQIPAASLAAATNFSTCIGASFTATCTGASVAATAVAGQIKIGQTLTGTGITAGTIVTGFAPGTSGGAGTYTVSATCTSSGASLTAAGIPSDLQGHIPTTVVLFVEGTTTAVRWRDDGGAPTATIGMEILTGSTYVYNGTVSALQFIAGTGSPLLDVAFYRSP